MLVVVPRPIDAIDVGGGGHGSMSVVMKYQDGVDQGGCDLEQSGLYLLYAPIQGERERGGTIGKEVNRGPGGSESRTEDKGKG